MRTALWLILFTVAAQAGDSSRSEWFRSLKQPGSGFSCCDISDCRRTEAEWRGEGWAALSRVPGKGWVSVPRDKVLEQPKSLDGDAYLCELPNAKVLCFVPPDFGS